jgi:molybdate transport system regulatory protein
MPTFKKHKPSAKIWIEYKGEPLIGKGGADILEAIAKENSLTEAAKNLHMSYRYLWNYVRKTEGTIGESIITTFKGGKAGGGGAKLTPLGQDLLSEYKRLEECLSGFLSDPEHWEVVGLKISARNQLKGKVLLVETDGITAKVKVQIHVPAVITSVITKEAVEDLGIKVGDEVSAVVKSTEIMIAK